ncbi:hypothetical protein CR513_08023, partial [Mucuna pruriens]
MRCFTFQDFQLAPTLEEYERLLELPVAKSPQYFYRGHYPSWVSIARLVRVVDYKAWLKCRIEQIGLPFRNLRQEAERMLASNIPKTDKAKEFKNTIRKMEEEQKALMRKLKEEERTLKRKLEEALAAQTFAQEEAG